MRANLDEPPIHIRPIVSESAGTQDKNPVSSGHYGTAGIASRPLNRNGVHCKKRQESGIGRLKNAAADAVRERYRIEVDQKPDPA